MKFVGVHHYSDHTRWFMRWSPWCWMTLLKLKITLNYCGCQWSAMSLCLADRVMSSLRSRNSNVISSNKSQMMLSSFFSKNKITFKRTRSLSNAVCFKYVKYLTTNTVNLVLLYNSLLYIKHTYYTVSQKKRPTIKLSVTLSNLNRFSKLLHCWKAYKIRYKTNTTLPTSP